MKIQAHHKFISYSIDNYFVSKVSSNTYEFVLLSSNDFVNIRWKEYSINKHFRWEEKRMRHDKISECSLEMLVIWMQCEMISSKRLIVYENSTLEDKLTKVNDRILRLFYLEQIRNWQVRIMSLWCTKKFNDNSVQWDNANELFMFRNQIDTRTTRDFLFYELTQSINRIVLELNKA